MEIKSQSSVDMDADVICDVCKCSTRIPGFGLQYGRLEAQWGYGSQHDGENYRVHLCEPCFFRVLSGLRRERMVNGMFDDDEPFSDDSFGLISMGNTPAFNELLALAIDVLGGREVANAWLHTPALGLSGARPIDLLSSARGSDQVRDFLLRLQHGVYQ